MQVKIKTCVFAAVAAAACQLFFRRLKNFPTTNATLPIVNRMFAISRRLQS
jgi:hypothetical protein